MTRFGLPADAPPAAERWDTPAYAEQVRAFVEAAVGPADLERTKLCGWSTVWRAEAGGERYWFKENTPLNAFEAPLLAVAAEVAPERFAHVVAHDPVSGMLLTADHGPVLAWKEMTDDDHGRIVASWAEVQRGLVAVTDRLVGAGAPVLAPGDAEAVATERIDALAALPTGEPRRLGEDDAAAARAALPAVRRAAEVVAGLGLPLALNHNDLHGGNVLAAAPGAPPRFFDLGDAMLTDPAAVLLTPLRVLQHVVGCPDDDVRLRRVAESWVEVWSDGVPVADLRAALPSSLLLAALPKHDAWLRATTAMSADERVEWGSAPAEYLAALAQPPILR